MSQSDLAVFRDIVLEDAGRQAGLRELADEAAFIAAVCAQAVALGLDVQPEDVRAEMQAARRTWIERWIA